MATRFFKSLAIIHVHVHVHSVCNTAFMYTWICTFISVLYKRVFLDGSIASSSGSSQIISIACKKMGEIRSTTLSFLHSLITLN